jgi:PKD repeat protein
MTNYDPPALHYTKLQLLIEGPVTADYTVNISSGMAPLTVEFTDISSGFPSDVWYEFGDGTEANVSAPSLTHTYTSSGMFTPVIHASNSISSDTGTNATIIVGTPPGITPDAAIGGVVDNLYKGSVPPETSLQVSNDFVLPHEVLTLLDGTTIENPLDYTAWVVVTDDDKNANLFHEVCYVFVNADDVMSDKICVMSPPADASAFSYSNQGHIPNPAGRISSQFPPVPDPACSPDATNNYALLISGGIDKDHNYLRYYNDIAFLYKTLVKDYKYDKSRIKVLMSDGSANTANDLVASYTTANPPAPVYGNSNTDLDGDGSPETWNSATRSNVLSALGSYSNLGTSANLFIFTTSHGASTTNKADPNTNDVDLYLWGTGVEGKISDTDFVNALPANPKISMTMEQCNGGGFKDEFIPSSGTRTRILATAARGDKVSKSNDFSYYWITGVAGHDSLGYPANADTTNINGQVSMKEAFDYANYLDPSASLELPQFFDYAGGAGAGQYFSACSATPPGITVTTPAGAWTKGGTYTVTWSRTGTWPSPTPYVKVLLMKGPEPGIVQATISSSKLSSAGGTGASYLVPACLNGGPGTDYWIKIITNAITPPISGRSSTFSISGVTTCAKTTLWIKSLPDPASLGATIDIKDTNGVPLTVDEHYTNYQYPSVSPGTYYVKLAKTCFYNMLSPQSHTVIAGVPSTRTITLTPLPVLAGGTTCDNSLTGSIAIYSIPDEGYQVFIRSISDPGFTDIGRNTPMIEEIGQGDYIVRLEADGYVPQEKPVAVTAGQQASVTFELERLPGWSEFSGFYNPIQMGILNSAKAGSAVPIVWHLSDADGNDVSDPASFSDLVSYEVACPNSRVMPASSYGTKVYPGSSGLQYLEEGNWQINWKTQKNYAGTCRNMYVEFVSGQKSPEVTFQFKK